MQSVDAWRWPLALPRQRRAVGETPAATPSPSASASSDASPRRRWPTRRSAPAASGTLAFPNSGAPAAQDDFLRGVAWLHSFGYEDAIAAFRAAQAKDPRLRDGLLGRGAWPSASRCGSSRNPRRAARRWPGWARRPEARMAKARHRRASAASCARSRRCGDQVCSRSRAQAFAEAMAAVAAANPGDDEAQVFYALALLGTLPRGDASLPMREKAGAHGRGGVRAQPEASRRRAPDPARLRSRRPGAARPGRGPGLRGDRPGGEPRAPHAGALLRAARTLARRPRTATGRRGRRRWRGSIAAAVRWCSATSTA